jgi:hypothetical protein
LFCARIATRRLIGPANRALRASLGLGSVASHVDRLIAGLNAEPTWDYALVDGRWAPSPDPRPLPPFIGTA